LDIFFNTQPIQPFLLGLERSFKPTKSTSLHQAISSYKIIHNSFIYNLGFFPSLNKTPYQSNITNIHNQIRKCLVVASQRLTPKSIVAIESKIQSND